MHPLIKVPAIVGTVITVALLVAGAFASSNVPYLVSVGTAATTILAVVSQAITVKQAAKAGRPVAPLPPKGAGK